MSPASPSLPWWQRLREFFVPGAAADPDVDLPRDFLELLERLRVLSVRATGVGLRQGHRLGAYRGGQLEFHDYRAYVPGDDLRYLDWNLYARMEKAFIKEFAREEAGAVHLLLDATPSMALGHPSKWTFARRLAALFAHVAWTGQDLVQVVIFRSPGLPPSTYPPRGTNGTTAQLLDWLRRHRFLCPPPFPPAHKCSRQAPSPKAYVNSSAPAPAGDASFCSPISGTRSRR